jgi:hypothetical protein
MLPEVAEAHMEDGDVDLSIPVADLMTARHLLIELSRKQAKAAQLKATLASIQGEYRSRIAALEEREGLIRQSLVNYCNQNGSVSFPDVGSCSVTHRDAKPRIVDADALGTWLLAQGYDGAASQRVVYDVDGKAASVIVEATLATDGELPPGVELSPASESLTVRGLR